MAKVPVLRTTRQFLAYFFLQCCKISFFSRIFVAKVNIGKVKQNYEKLTICTLFFKEKTKTFPFQVKIFDPYVSAKNVGS